MTWSWVTVVWLMIASACLTLAGIYFLVWLRNHGERAHLFFSINAISMTAFAFGELWMMRVATTDEAVVAFRFAHVGLVGWLLSNVWFVKSYLRSGRAWLAWTILVVRLAVMPFNFLPGENLTFREITHLEQVQFFGETVVALRGNVNPLQVITQIVVILIMVFVADASMTAWRRGDRRKALVVGGSVEFTIVAAFATAMPVTWGLIRAPYIFSLPYMCLVLVMAYEMSRDLLRASQLLHELRATEAGLRENQARLQASNQQNSDLAGRLIASQEVERARLARDLHDDLSQQIAGLSIALSALKHRLGVLPHAGGLSADVSLLQQRAVGLADNMRRLSHDLHPSVLQHAGLVAALGEYCGEVERQQSVVVRFTAEGEFESTVAAAKLCLYRVAQEGLRNVVSHAKAGHAEVRLRRVGHNAELTITDNGQGFDVSPAGRRSHGLGLVSISERVRLAGGTVTIVTEMNKGTRIHVQIPANGHVPEAPRTEPESATTPGVNPPQSVARSHT